MMDLLKSWDGKVVTIEMDPVIAVLARNIIEFAGFSNFIDVQVGHSDEAVEIVREMHGQQAFQMVFMDQRGTRFHHDLEYAESLGILDNPCVVVADNALKPGAPLYLWRVCHLPQYSTDVVALPEFGSSEVEDWMTVSWLNASNASQGQKYSDRVA
eukprot:gnl/MRDRNA2_/MRDRNA2_77550_c0_seq1.p1 gnl/MRDRNA2_/MRDRNA2_77550_c0~~gnl/MRDRNA2_/MRDRNA2_77550_c0_seq1.p1  ORF type:complete len:156 (-),score=28.45 gnl/MRDRNA2_/MRDRNA2_77550_c0_seq1:2-469(-)